MYPVRRCLPKISFDSLTLSRLVITLKSKISAEELPAATMRPGTESCRAEAGKAEAAAAGPRSASCLNMTSQMNEEGR